jgi:hypothetical protein
VSSPDSLATPTSSQFDNENQIDELFLQSSPNTEVTPVQALENAKMGMPPIVCRVALLRIFDSSFQTKLRSHATENLGVVWGMRVVPAKDWGVYCSSRPSQDYSLTPVSSFSSFIVPLISDSRVQRQQVVAPPICPSPPLSDSMIGQATSVNRTRTELNSDGDLDTSVGQMYACVEGWCPEEIILSERLSEKDGQLLDGGSCM